MERYYENLAICFAAMLIIGACYLLFGFYWEDYESFVAAFIYGQPVSPPKDQWNINAQFLLVPAFVKISSILPSVPVYGIWMCSLNFLWLSAVIKLIINIKNEYQMSVWQWVPLAIATVSIVIDSIPHVNMVRISIMLTSSAVLLFAENHSGRVSRLIYLFLFLLGVMTRMHTALLVFGFIMFSELLNGRQLKLLARQYSLHALIFVLVMGAYHIDRATTKHLGKIIETKYEYALIDKQALIPLSEMKLKTKMDTMKYHAACALFADTVNINEHFYSKIVKTERHVSDFISMQQWQHAISQLNRFIALGFSELLGILIITALLLITTSNPIHLLMKLMKLHGFFWILILGLTISVNMFSRFFFPILSVLGILTFKSCYAEKLKIKAYWPYALVFIVGIVVMTLKGYQLQESAEFHRIYENDVKKNIAQLQAHQKDAKVIVLFDCFDNLFSKNPFERIPGIIYSEILFPDLLFWTHFKFARKRIIEEYGFNPLNFSEYCQFLKKEHDNILILSSEGRLKLLTEYLEIVYGCRFTVKPVEIMTARDNCSYYRIEPIDN